MLAPKGSLPYLRLQGCEFFKSSGPLCPRNTVWRFSGVQETMLELGSVCQLNKTLRNVLSHRGWGVINITVDMVDSNSQADSNKPGLQATASPFEAMFGGCIELDRFAKWREVGEWLTVSTDGSVQCTACSEIKDLDLPAELLRCGWKRDITLQMTPPPGSRKKERKIETCHQSILFS